MSSMWRAVDDELLRARRQRVEPLADVVEGTAVAVVDGDQVAAADEGVDLFQVDPAAAVRVLRPVVDEEHVAAEILELRPLPLLAQVLQRERMEVEDVVEGVDISIARSV
jgi:hypothetical protein